MRTPMEIKRILAAARVPYPHILMDELEEAQGEVERLTKELERAHYALNAIQMGEWSCTYDEQGLEVWTTRRINPGRIASEALALKEEEQS